MPAYSFLNVQATIAGPGGTFSIGTGTGPAEEGISYEPIEAKDDMKVGADGAIMHSLRASMAARITVRVLKTSPVNALLSALYNFQRQSAATWGQNTMLVSDTQRGDVFSGSLIAFENHTGVTWAKDAGMNEWRFQGNVLPLLGAGVPDVNT